MNVIMNESKTEVQYVNSTSTDEEIIAALAAAGVQLPRKKLSRARLILKCEQAKIWVQLKRSAVPDSYKLKYGKDANCGDEMAQVLKDEAKTPDEVDEVAAQNGIDMGRWAGRNNGMRRMNLSNVLRGRIRRGELVLVGVHKWNETMAEGDEAA